MIDWINERRNDQFYDSSVHTSINPNIMTNSGYTFLLSIQSLKSLSIQSSWADMLASITHGGGYTGKTMEKI